MSNNELDIETYRGLIDQDSSTMKSTDLHKFVYEATGKFKELKHFHEKIRVIMYGTKTPTDAQIFGSRNLRPTLRDNNQVEYYNLSETYCNMIVASVDVGHLELLAEVFVKVKNSLVDEKPKLSPMEQLANAVLLANNMVEEEKKQKEKALKMLEAANVISANQHISDSDISIDTFCKVISDKLDNVMMGRTTCYVILREIGIVEQTSTRPTQRGMSVYLTYRKHDYGYSTRVFTDKADQLIKLMIKTLSNNRSLDGILGHPLGDL